MATWDDVRRLALALPETDERESRGSRQWRVKEKLFVWERPLRRIRSQGTGRRRSRRADPGCPGRACGAKEALVADASGVYFTTPHFDGYPAILVQLEKISVADLEEVTVEAWLARAPAKLAKAYLADR